METYKQRIEYTEIYLHALERSLQTNWFSQYGKYVNGDIKLPDAFALIHPWHYEDITTTGQECPIRGSQRFMKEQAISSIKCKASLIWGYECPLSHNLVGNVQADHLFPYSLGGPTVASNKIYLCTIHNQMKANDLHVYPWERGKPDWLSDCLKNIAKRKGFIQ